MLLFVVVVDDVVVVIVVVCLFLYRSLCPNSVTSRTTKLLKKERILKVVNVKLKEISSFVKVSKNTIQYDTQTFWTKQVCVKNTNPLVPLWFGGFRT